MHVPIYSYYLRAYGRAFSTCLFAVLLAHLEGVHSVHFVLIVVIAHGPWGIHGVGHASPAHSPTTQFTPLDVRSILGWFFLVGGSRFGSRGVFRGHVCF